jgi:hypothetical protein
MYVKSQFPTKLKFQVLILIFTLVFACAGRETGSANILSLSGFSSWQTGHDSETIQLIPENGNNALKLNSEDKVIAHVKFAIKEYGEMSFPLNSKPGEGKATGVDLSSKSYVVVTYLANHDLVLQLRQTGIHGGIHNHVRLPRADQIVSDTIYFSEFEKGLKPLDLSDVEKFNFAFLSNNSADGLAELEVHSFSIGPRKD